MAQITIICQAGQAVASSFASRQADRKFTTANQKLLGAGRLKAFSHGAKPRDVLKRERGLPASPDEKAYGLGTSPGASPAVRRSHRLLQAWQPLGANQRPRTFTAAKALETREQAPVPGPWDKPGWPNVEIYPAPGFGWQKPVPKCSLERLKEDSTASPWILNLIQFIHWVPYFTGSYVAYDIAQHLSALATHMGGSNVQAFLLMLAPLVQVFGGSMAIVMHEYEGWQVTEFRNPLKEDFSATDYNNAWLREVAYKLLFTLQTAGLLVFSLGAYGLTPAMILLTLATAGIAFLGPQDPKVTFTFNDQPAFPLSLSLTLVFIVNAVLNLAAYVHVFGDAAKDFAGGSEWGVLLALVPPVLVAAGGIVEGIVAETTFNQWWHFVAFVLLNLGMVANIPAYNLLFATFG